MGLSSKLKSTLLVLAASTLPIAHAQQAAIPGQQFVNDPLSVVEAAAPAWLLPANTCFPTSAILNDGTVDPGLPNSLCSVDGLDSGCPSEPPSNAERTTPNNFPTYYTMQYCDDQPDYVTWRVLYDIYFQKDTGHRYDWEWVVIAWKKQPDGTFLRDALFMEQDPNVQHYIWDNVDTYTDDTKVSDKNLEHPKLYISKWHHSVHPDLYKVDANGCSAGDTDYRGNDYLWEAKNNLTDASLYKAWPNNADGGLSEPSQFVAGGSKDMCRYGQ